MPKKKSGFPYEVHPTPVKGKDGRNIVYARPARGRKLSIEAVDSYCHENYELKSGELEFVFKQFLKCASEGLKREITNADDVEDSDVQLEGVDYNPGKIWNKAIEEWLFNGFLRVENPNVQELMQDTEYLEQALKECLKRGFVTVKAFTIQAHLTDYSARKQLEAWTQGENPKLTKSTIGHTDIYTEI